MNPKNCRNDLVVFCETPNTPFGVLAMLQGQTTMVQGKLHVYMGTVIGRGSSKLEALEDLYDQINF